MPQERLNQRLPLLALAIATGLAALVCCLVADAPARKLLWNSARLCLASAAIALPLGSVLAVLLARTNVLGRSAAILLVATLLFLPLHATAAGWVAVFGKLGSQSPAFFQTARPLLEGMPAVIWIHAMAAVPWVALIVSLGLLAIPREMEDAALLEMSPARMLLFAGRPYVLPFLAAAGLWVVLSTAGEMTVTNLYMVPTYTEELYNSQAMGEDAARAGVRLLPSIAAMVLLVVLALGVIAAALPAGRPPQFRRPSIFKLGAWAIPTAALLWLIIAGIAGVPIASLIRKAGNVMQAVGEEHVSTWSPAALLHLGRVVAWNFRGEFIWSFVLAGFGAWLSLIAALPLAALARRGGVRAWPAMGAAAIGWAIPGPVVGLVLIWLLNRDIAIWLGSQKFSPLIFLYDKTLLAPALAVAIKALPITLLVLWYAFESVSERTLEAARLDGAGSASILFRVLIPQRWAEILAAWIVAFAIGLGDLAWSILVLPPGMESVQRRVFGLIHYGVEEQVAGVSLITLGHFGVLALLTVLLLRRKSRGHKPT